MTAAERARSGFSARGVEWPTTCLAAVAAQADVIP
jgi:hypothetical protein